MSKIKLNESQLHEIIRESVNMILNEKRGLKSMKLYNILKQHGGFGEGTWKYHVSGNFSDLSDEDILGVMTYQEIVDLQRGHTIDHGRWSDNYGMDKWAKERGFKLSPNDRVEVERMRDGMFLVYIGRNIDFDRTNYQQEGGFKDYFKTRSAREKNWRNDGKHSYQWNNRAAEDMFRNYGTIKHYWSDENRKERLEKARNHQDWWGNKV